MIILDVGAGDGRRCVKWLQKFKDCLVYAFEPDPRQFAKLEQTYSKLKPAEQRRFKLYNAAAWKSNGEVDLHVCNDPSSSSVLPFVKDNIKKWKYPPGRYFFNTEKVIKVQAIRLDNVIKKEKIRVIDFLRIDVQGCAKEVLQGITVKNLKHVKEIFVKVHVLPMEIYKGQSTRKEIESIVFPHYFLNFSISTYSRGQEAWIRYHSDVWKRTRGSKIYGLD